MSKDLRNLVQQRQFHALSENNVPLPGVKGINLLKTQDMSAQERNKLSRAGLGDLLYHPTADLISSAIVKDRLQMELETQG